MQTEGGTGHPGFICHKQPAIEKHLRTQINSSSSAQLRLGSTLKSIREDHDWVYVNYTDASGKVKHLRSKFLVGADGKKGFTRKMYLEPRGIQMENVSEMSYEQVWVALNWKMSLPTPETHPEFPLWAKGYSPQQVYDIFFPTNFRFLCNPKRPAVCGRFGLPEDRLWRFEFLVHPGEDGEVMAGPEKIQEIVFPWITHRGAVYGLETTDIQYPEDCIEVLRSRPFKFSARSCNKWAQDRVILCGDAAHVFPPFGGQGIASGFRDAISLAWRLVLATRQPSWTTQSPNYNQLFLGWYLERKQQFDMSLASTVENGNYVNESNPIKIFLRNWYLWAVQLVPKWKHQLEMGNRREGMAKYNFQPGKGMAFLQDLAGGGNFPQVYCASLTGKTPGKVYFTDDVIFAAEHKGLFQAVVLISSKDQINKMGQLLNDVDALSKGALRAEEATYILLNTRHESLSDDGGGRAIYRLATAEEFTAEKSLSQNRPSPQYYDPYRVSAEVGGRPIVILRPDRFVFAACRGLDEVNRAAEKLSLLATGEL